MKFTCFQIGQVGLILACCVVVTACNKEDFFKAEEFLVGKDAYCFQEGPDLASCHAMGDECRAAYVDAEDETQAPEFLMCIANPDYSPNDGSDTGATDAGGTDAGGSDAGGTSGGGSNAGGSNGGGNNAVGSNGGGTTGDDSSVPTLDEAFHSKCLNLDPKYLWVKKEVSKKGTKVTSKVKVCHQTGNGSAHTIVIACPALKAHVKHDDYLGACEE